MVTTCLLLAAAVAAAPPPAGPGAAPAPAAADANPQAPPPAGLDGELKAAAAWLLDAQDAGAVAPADAPYFRFFTTYAVPATPLTLGGGAGPPLETTLRDAAPLVLSFVLNSLASPQAEGKPVRPRAVTPTLFVVDIRDFGWDVERFEAALRTDPYVVEPLVDHGLYNFGRTQAGNMLVRADWFVVHATDARRQLDRGLKADDVIYYTLTYGVKGVPANLAEFQKAWGVDAALAARFKADFATIVEKGKSGVSRGVRRVVGYRTVLGTYWETLDAANEDYVENVLSDSLDAGETITNNTRGLQTYLLYNAQKARVEDGDVKLVIDGGDPRDARVRTASSCIICHPLGINPCSNALADLIRQGVEFKAQYQDFARKVERLYLAGTLDATVAEANARYAQAVAACNDLAPTQNAVAFKALYDWYAYAPLTAAQCAVEVGLPEAEFLAKVAATASGRLAALVRGKVPIDRQFWEAQVVEGAVVGGAYAESVLHVRGRTVAPVVLVPAVAAADDAPPAPGTHRVVLAAAAPLMAGARVLAELPAGTVLEYTGTSGDWVGVTHNGAPGYVARAKCRIERTPR